MSEEQRRQAYLDELRRILPPSEPWEAWLAASGELPPDFAALPSCAGLPDPLGSLAIGHETADGGHSLSAAAWHARREELQALFAQWVLGRTPPAPGRLAAQVVADQTAPGITVRQVRLAFGPGDAATLRLELLIPDGASAEPAANPRPVFLTQHNHRHWALIAVRRGYLGCVYAGADSLDDTDTFARVYPEFDWSRLTRRAWAASRCVDYLAEFVPQADTERIVLTGHSRNGKLSLIAAALDERITTVISSSSGAGGSVPFRDFGEHHFGESVELLTRAFPDWFHPRLRFFAGREHKLPVDMHELVALCAPRPCLLSCALNDAVESVWALQQTYLSARRVYALLGAADRLGLLWRPGGHETWTTLIERYLDWSDAQLGYAPGQAAGQANPAAADHVRLLLPADWEAWRRESGDTVDPQRLPPFGDTAAAVRWLLGEAPPGGRPAGPEQSGRYGAEAPHVAALLGRAAAGDGLEKHPLVFGEYVPGDIFAPAGTAAAGERVPAALWLHPFSVPRGYIAGYMRGEQPVRTLARAGFAVLGFDQIGHGRRIEEAEHFYRRHLRWSLFGKMLRDSQAALDALPALPFVDPAQIWVVGYSLGALVGLHLCALDSRPAGLAAVCLPPPFRTDTDVAETGGFQRWARRSLLLPRLGHFDGHPAQIPYDLDDLLAALAPRPTLVVSPTLDREAPLHRVTEAVERARLSFAAQDAVARLTQVTPLDYNRFVPHVQDLVATWLREQVRAE